MSTRQERLLSANLETVGDKLKVYSLQDLLHNKRAFRTRAPEKLAAVLEPWYEKAIAKPASKLGGISDLWLELVPAAILEHSRLAGFHRGTLQVTLSSAPVRAELEALLRRGLLAQLQAASRGAVFRVKTAVDHRAGHSY